MIEIQDSGEDYLGRNSKKGLVAEYLQLVNQGLSRIYKKINR